jgi:hypothetical protein
MVLPFRPVADDHDRERCADTIATCRAARERLLARHDEMVAAPGAPNLRIPGSTGVSALLGSRWAMRRARRRFHSYVESLLPTHPSGR